MTEDMEETGRANGRKPVRKGGGDEEAEGGHAAGTWR